jgi:hypothetical protein
MPTYDPEKFVNREEELVFVRERTSRLAKGDPFAPHERVIHFVGPSGIGKSCLLEKCCEITGGAPEYVPVLIKLQTLRRGYENFVDDFLAAVDDKFSNHLGILAGRRAKGLQHVGSEILRKVKNNIRGKVFILFLDEIDLPTKAELQGIEEHLLEKLLHDNERVVIITAGRVPAGLNDFALRPSAANKVMLSAFDVDTTGKQLEKLRSGSVSLAGKIRELGGGIPGNNTKLSVHVVGDPPKIPDELKAIQTLLGDLKRGIAERFHRVLEAMCVLQAFFPEDAAPLVESHYALTGLWDENKIKEAFPELKQVQIGPGGLINWDREKKSWAMDEPTRLLLERELQMRDPELWRKLHCTAIHMYMQWGEELKSQLYKDKADYHQRCLQSAGLGCADLETRVEL